MASKLKHLVIKEPDMCFIGRWRPKTELKESKTGHVHHVDRNTTPKEQLYAKNQIFENRFTAKGISNCIRDLCPLS